MTSSVYYGSLARETMDAGIMTVSKRRGISVRCSQSHLGYYHRAIRKPAHRRARPTRPPFCGARNYSDLRATETSRSISLDDDILGKATKYDLPQDWENY